MHQLEIRTAERVGRSDVAWPGESLGYHSRFAEIALALVPASLILAAATTLLVALL